jgi:hypothetical protein
VNHVDNSLVLHCADNIANLTKEIGFKEGPLLAGLDVRERPLRALTQAEHSPRRHSWPANRAKVLEPVRGELRVADRVRDVLVAKAMLQRRVS